MAPQRKFRYEKQRSTDRIAPQRSSAESLAPLQFGCSGWITLTGGSVKRSAFLNYCPGSNHGGQLRTAGRRKRRLPSIGPQRTSNWHARHRSSSLIDQSAGSPNRRPGRPHSRVTHDPYRSLNKSLPHWRVLPGWVSWGKYIGSAANQGDPVKHSECQLARRIKALRSGSRAFRTDDRREAPPSAPIDRRGLTPHGQPNDRHRRLRPR